MSLFNRSNKIAVFVIFFLYFLFSIHATNVPLTSLFFKIQYVMNILFILIGIIVLFKTKTKINLVLFLVVFYLIFSSFLFNQYNTNFQLFNIIIDLFSYTIIGIILGQTVNFERIVNVLFYYFLLLAVLCILNAIFFPQMGKELSGEWRGVLYQKNALANVMVFGLIINYIYLLTKSTIKRSYRLCLGYTSLFTIFFLIVMTESATGLMVGISLSLAFFIFVLFYKIKNMNLKLVLISLTSILIIFLILTLLENEGRVFEFLGKDSNLTGRNVIFEYVKSIIKDHLFLGIGYSGIPNSYLLNSNETYQAIGFHVYYAHNGFLEILFQIGIVGILMYLYFYFTISKILLFEIDNIVKVFVLLFFVYNILYNLSEVTFLTGEGNNFQWFVMCLLITYYSRFKSIK